MSSHTPEGHDQQELIKVHYHNDDGLKSARLELNTGYSEVEHSELTWEGDGISVDVASRAEHLDHALGLLATMSRRDGFAQANKLPGLRSAIVDQYQSEAAADGFLKGSNFNNSKEQEQLEKGFPKLLGTEALVGVGLWTPEQGEAANRDYYAAFLRAYQDSDNEPRRSYDRRLANRASAVITQGARLTKLRSPKGPLVPRPELILEGPVSHEPEELVEHPKSLTEAELTRLSTREKLIALKQDPRAGFLPRTHDEKNLAVSLLNYIDEPNGVHLQLTEISDHQVKEMFRKKRALEAKPELTPDEQELLSTLTLHRSRELALAAQKSVGLEIYDYHSSAEAQLEGLKALEAALGGVSPRVSFREALAESDIDPVLEKSVCASLVQFTDLQRFRDRGIPPATYDPLRNVEVDRGNQPHPEKNKTVSDIYHGSDMPEVIERRIVSYVKAQKVENVNRLLTEAIIDRTNSVEFWTRVKNGLRGTVKRVVSDLDQVK